MSKRSVGASVVLLASALLGCRPASFSTPNVLLIVVDTLRADRLGAYGWSEPTSPTIDALAASGVLFESMHAQAPQTQPSFASILTGTYPMSHGVRANGMFSLAPEALSLAEILRQHGYLTAAVVAGFPLDSRFGIDQGFDSYHDEMSWPPTGRHLWSGHAMQAFESPAPQVGIDASLWLREAPDAPFFLMVHFFDPHYDYRPPPDLRRRFSHPYAGEIASVDRQIKRLLVELERLGKAENTLVVFTADHGECLGEHGRYAHQQYVTDATIHVPFILSLPRVLPAGLRIPGLARSVDILPTILELVGVPVPAKVEGRSLVAAIDQGRTSVEFAYFETLWGKLETNAGITRQGISDGEWKLVRQRREPAEGESASSSTELYHLASDPEETRNLREREPERSRQLEALLEAFLNEHREGRAQVVSPDPEVIDRLEALGYL